MSVYEEKLREKMSDANHPVSRMLTKIHARGTQSVHENDVSFKGVMLRALLKSKTTEHYHALYALWDDAPFKEASRLLIKLVFQMMID